MKEKLVDLLNWYIQNWHLLEHVDFYEKVIDIFNKLYTQFFDNEIEEAENLLKFFERQESEFIDVFKDPRIYYDTYALKNIEKQTIEKIIDIYQNN